MLRLEILQTKKLNRSIGEARVAWRSLAMAVPFAPGDALRFLLLSLCFMFLGAGVAFLVASDIVRGR